MCQALSCVQASPDETYPQILAVFISRNDKECSFIPLLKRERKEGDKRGKRKKGEKKEEKVKKKNGWEESEKRRKKGRGKKGGRMKGGRYGPEARFAS